MYVYTFIKEFELLAFIVGNNIISKDMFSIKCYNKNEKKNKEYSYSVVKDT